MPLIDRADSLLIVIDAQPGFAGSTDATSGESARSREVAAWLTGVAAALDVPIVVTEEDAATNGPTDPAIAARLPRGTAILPKVVFGLADEPTIMAAVESTGRQHRHPRRRGDRCLRRAVGDRSGRPRVSRRRRL